jgi:HlyD family secretion protein
MTEQTIQEPATKPVEQAQPKSRSRARPLIIVAVIVVVGLIVRRVFFAGPATPDNVVVLSGRIEGDDSAVAPKTLGRLLEVRVREGDEVKAGDIIAVLDDEQIRARQNQAQSALKVAEAKTASARDQVAVLQEQLKQSDLTTAQSEEDSQGRVRQAEADLTAAESDLAQQEASYKLAVFGKDAYTRLALTGAVSERQGKQSVATADQLAAAVAAAKRHVESAKGAVTTVRANLANPGIREAQASAIRQQLIQQQSEIAGDIAAAEQARYSLTEADANRQDLTIRAPFSGTIVTRAADPAKS